MKIKFNLLLLAIMFCTVIATAQSKSAMLIGTWKVESLQPKYPDNFTDKQKAKGAKIIADDQTDFKQVGFVFTKDMITIGKKKFSYVMNEGGTEVTVKKKDKIIAVATITALDNKHLVFTRPDEGMIVTYKLYR